MKRLRFLSMAAIAMFSLAAAACSGPAVAPSTSRRPPGLRTPPAPPAPPAGPTFFPGKALDALESPDAAHFFARRPDGSAVIVSERGGHLWSRALAADGSQKDAVDLGEAPQFAHAAVKPLGDGYLFAWAEATSTGSKVGTIALDAAGAARGARSVLASVSEEVTWIEIIASAASAVVAWEAESGAHVDVKGVAVNAQGASSGSAVAIVKDALGWHAARNGRAIVAVVSANPADEDESGLVRAGRVVLVPLAADGKPGAAVDVTTDATAEPDVEAIEIGGKLVLAWTDVRDTDAAVWTAVTDADGKVLTAPKRATPPTGEQALVALIGGEPGAAALDRGLVAWEDVLRAPPETRQIHLAALGADGSIGKERATLLLAADGTAPDLAADADGFSAITLAPAWLGGPPTPDAPVWPTYVRFGKDLSVISAEPVRCDALGPDGVPYLVHGLACTAAGCTTVATGGTETASVAALVSLPARKSDWFAPARRDADEAPPRPEALSVLYDGDQIARLAAAPIKEGVGLAGWVTYFLEPTGPGRAKASGGAELAIALVEDGARPGKPTVLSKKAVSLGGIAMATAPGDKPETAIAWVSRERGESHVFVTKVDATGAKVAQKQVTVIGRKKGTAVASEASDVAIAWTGGEGGDGWIVAWVDTRDGNAEVYAARVDRALTKIGPDKRITDAPGDAAEVQLLGRGKETFVAWSDSRQNPAEGKAEIYVARVATKGLQKVGNDVRVTTTPAHSRTPAFTTGLGSKVFLSWIEEEEEGAANAASGFLVETLDDQAAPLHATVRLRGADEGAVVSGALACGAKRCRGIVGSASGDALVLGAGEWIPGKPPSPSKALLTIPGAGAQDVLPVLLDRDAVTLLFAADAAGGTGRVRKLKTAW